MRLVNHFWSRWICSITGKRKYRQPDRNNWGHLHSCWSSFTWIVICVCVTKCWIHMLTYSLYESWLQTLFLIPVSLISLVGTDFVLAFPWVKEELKAQMIRPLRNTVGSKGISIMYFSLVGHYDEHISLFYPAKEMIWDIINDTCPLFVHQTPLWHA